MKNIIYYLKLSLKSTIYMCKNIRGYTLNILLSILCTVAFVISIIERDWMLMLISILVSSIYSILINILKKEEIIEASMKMIDEIIE